MIREGGRVKKPLAWLCFSYPYLFMTTPRLTKTAAMELGPHNIRVNAICPGSVDGPRIEGVIEREAQARQVAAEVVRQSYLRKNSLRTFIQAEEVANLVLFICSDLGARISGQALGLDGHTETLAQL